MTPLCTQFNNVRNQASTASDQTAIDVIDSWLGGILDCKSFLQLHRNFLKGGSKLEKAPLLKPKLDLLIDFLRRKSVVVSNSLVLLKLKVDFVDDGTMHGGVSVLIDGDVDSVFARHLESLDQHSNVPDFGLWARSLFLHNIESFLNSIKLIGEDFEGRLAEFCLDARDAKATVDRKFNGDRQFDYANPEIHFETIVIVIDSTYTLLANAVQHEVADVTPPTPDAVQSALNELCEGAYFKPLAKSLKLPAGVELVQRAKNTVAVQAGDMLGNEQALKAYRLVTHDQMMRRVLHADAEGRGVYLFVNCTGDSAHTLASALTESMGHLIEASAMWTPQGRRAGKMTLTSWACKVKALLTIYDQAETIDVVSATQQLGFVSAECRGEDGENEFVAGEDGDAAIADAASDPLAGQPTQCLIDVTAGKAIGDVLTQMQTHLPSILSGAAVDDTFIESLMRFFAMLLDHINIRHSASLLEAELRGFSDQPETTEEALRAWSITRTGDADIHLATSIEVARRVSKLTAQLHTGRFDCASDPCVDYADHVMLESGKQCHDWSTMTKEFHQTITNCPVQYVLTELLAECKTVLFSKVVEGLGVFSLIANAGATPIEVEDSVAYEDLFGDGEVELIKDGESCSDAATVCGRIDELVQATVAEHLVREVTTHGSDKSTLLPCEAYGNLLKELTAEVKMFHGGHLVRGDVDVSDVELFQMLSALYPITNVVATTAMFRQHCLSGSLCVEATVAPCVINGLVRLSKLTAPDWNTLETHLAPWAVPPRDLHHWWQRMYAVVPLMKRATFAELSERVHVAAQKCEATPPFAHFVSDTFYSRPLAQRHLLPNAVRTGLKENLKRISKDIATLKDCYEKLELAPGLDKDPEFQPVKQYIDTVYAKVSKTSLVVACCVVVQEVAQEEKGRQAGLLLAARGIDIPGALKAALEALSSTTVVTPAVKRQRITAKTPAPIVQGLDEQAAALAISDAGCA